MVFHGYLLHGTGSNVYNASLAQALARLGHEVHLLCQDRHAGELEWVDRIGRWEGGELRLEGDREAKEGSVSVYTPDIGGLLPVYVPDRYEGFEVKVFPELGDDELDRYLEANVAAVRDVVDAVGGVDAALANHLIMAPVILGRAGLAYALKVHGSDLSYTVLPHIERFRPYAREACEGAAGILVGSGHIAERLREAVDDPAINAKVRLGPPGVDTDLFSPVSKDAARGRLEELATELREMASKAAARVAQGASGPGSRTIGPEVPGPTPPRQDPRPSVWDRDLGAAVDAVEWFAATTGPRVVFVGKLIVSKGVDLLLAAWPLVAAKHPGARLLIVGFGGYDEALRRLWSALVASDLEAAREIAVKGRALEGGDEHRLRMLGSFLDAHPAGYPEAASAASGSVSFAGRLEHGEVARLVPAADALVFPSTFPEAFGMVAAEAAAAGVLPISADHSGAAEVSRELSKTLPPEVAPLVSFPLGEDVVTAIAARLDGWLGMDDALRARARAALRETVERLWSWEGVAQGVLAASAGELGQVPPVSE